MKEISEQAKAAQREYLREWRRRNPEKVRENNRRYWERKAERLEREGRAVLIRPVRPLRVDRLERDVLRLSSLYDEGLRVCRDNLRRIAAL